MPIDDLKALKKLDAVIRHTRQNTQMTERLLAHQVWLALGDDKIVSFPYQNVTVQFFVPDGWLDAVQRIIMLNRTFYEVSLLERIRALVPPGAVFVDAGANVGNHSIFFARVCAAAKVHAFEPMPHMQAILRRNAELNGLHQIEVNPVALGDAEGSIGVQIFNPANLGSTTLDAGVEGSLPMRTMDSFALQDVAFIKIDVEGMQNAVLRGAQETIARCKPVMVIEAFDRGDERTLTQDLLATMGYTVTEIVGHNLIAMPT